MRFKHTEQTAAIYNSMIKEYREIQSDSDLERAGLSYDDYRSSDFGLFLDMLRFDGIGFTSSKDVAEWAKRHGCFVTKEENRWTVRLQEVEDETGN